jgi:phosphate transport system ATP-binding protein
MNLFSRKTTPLKKLTPENIAVNIESLSVELNNKVVLDNISMRIPAYSITSIIGQSGCGKTTLLNSMKMSPDSERMLAWYSSNPILFR